LDRLYTSSAQVREDWSRRCARSDQIPARRWLSWRTRQRKRA